MAKPRLTDPAHQQHPRQSQRQFRHRPLVGPLCHRPARHPPARAGRAQCTRSAPHNRRRRARSWRVRCNFIPLRPRGLNISVYAPAGAAAAATAYGEAAARIAVAFSDQFGPLAQRDLSVAQFPDGSLPSFAAPGLLLVSQRQWSASVNTRLLSNLVAAQWWGQQVMAAEPSSVWLTDGLARYSEALYVEQAENKEAMNKALEDFAVGSLMYEGSAPIAEAGRIPAFSADYTSVVVNKGAMVFHMLREQMGDTAFFSLLRDFATQFSGKTASLADFEKMAVDRAAKVSNKSAGDSPAGGFVLRNYHRFR